MDVGRTHRAQEHGTHGPPEVHRARSTMYYCLAGDDVGLRAAADLVFADLRPRMLPRYWELGAQRFRGPSQIIISPVKRMTFDIFLHNSIQLEGLPELRVYNPVERGEVIIFDDPDRKLDIIKTHDVIRPIPARVACAKLRHVPRYTEMLQYVYDTIGWDSSEFRGYRLDVEYPIYAAQYRIGFKLPERPVG